MSKAKFKNAKKVWEALIDLSTPRGEQFYVRQYHTAGEVAKVAGVSYNTARQYLDIAEKEGAALLSTWYGKREYRIVREDERNG